MSGRLTRILTAAALLLALLAMLPGAGAEEAPDLTGDCLFKMSYGGTDAGRMTDGKYTTSWHSNEAKRPYVIISSETPVYGLYLCFREMPESWEIQSSGKSNAARSKVQDGDWHTVAQGDTRFYHVYIPLNGEKNLRIIGTAEKKCVLGFNELYVFGQGETPAWVQRWEPTEEKADILFLSTHPDDELLFFGGAIPTYAGQLQKRVVVAYLTWSNTTRRSELLNGLWHLGVRHYPVFAGIRDVYSSKAEEAYKKVGRNGKEKVQGWLTGVLRQVKPEVVVTQDADGEYGHGQHKMAADAARACYDLAADPEAYPESAALYGTWQVKKLYLHLWGEEADQTKMDWEQPLSAFGGKTGTELAEEAYALHVTQRNAGTKIRGKRYVFSVRETGGVLFPNTVFGLCRTEVGPDETHTDFLEHIPAEE